MAAKTINELDAGSLSTDDLLLIYDEQANDGNGGTRKATVEALRPLFFAVVSAAPTAAVTDIAGTVKIDATNNVLYVCTVSGDGESTAGTWKKVTLSAIE